ncbi:response regulator (plasmid) [Methylobacterium sp. NMS12]|uniref:response regulator n=1 Tax=Methylobacterium sp. NMS12 TaxID=3079766 RepID=UPI003F8809D1
MDPSATDRRPYALVTDDDVLVRLTAVDILEDAGFRTFEAGNAEEALSILREHHASIVVLFTDVNMPGSMDGFELAREVALHWPHVSILVASGRHEPGPGQMPDGAHFVGKPFSAEVVRDRLKQMLPDGQKPDPLRG